jgi:hypothetical protein
MLTPSLLFSIDDPILPYQMLKIALQSYVGKSESIDYTLLRHPLISPAFASDETLSKFPAVTFMIAMDSFRDDNFKLALRLM